MIGFGKYEINDVLGQEQYINHLELELMLIQNELVNTLTPSVLMTKITGVVCEMLEDNLSYSKKNGFTETAKKHRERLLFLLEYSEQINLFVIDMNKMKITNRYLSAENTRLKNELSEIKRQENISNSL